MYSNVYFGDQTLTLATPPHVFYPEKPTSVMELAETHTGPVMLSILDCRLIAHMVL